MATIEKTVTDTWQELSSEQCIFQKLSVGDCYIQYADSAPSAGYSSSYLITGTQILNLPAPATGAIYIAAPQTTRVVVTGVA